MSRSVLAEREVVASQARGVSGNSGAIDVQPGAEDLALAVAVTAISGTGATLALAIEWSADGGTTWYAGDPADVFANLTTAVNRIKSFQIKARKYRVVWTITGTGPSVTFSIRESPTI